MKNPLQIIDKKSLDWLLEKENPSVRYFTLTNLLGKSETDDETISAKNEIMTKGIVPVLLDKMNENGYWGEPGKFYHDKYKGSVWQIIILAELGVDGNNHKIKKACEFILENAQDIESGGFSVHKSESIGGGRHNEVIPCLTGNLLRSLIKLGFTDDDRIKKGIEWICSYQRSDDVITNHPTGWPYDRFISCWGKHSCHMGVVKSLKALASIPVEKRDKIVNEKIQNLAEYILIHHIYKKSHDLSKVSKPGWLKLGFPLMYQTDILEILSILTELGYKDKRMEDAVDKLKNKQQEDKRWILENTFNDRVIKNIEVKGKPSKWITLKAVNVLMRY